jgi:hypothetical protein
MKDDLSQIAVMTIAEGEEFFTGQTSVHIPQVGIYKLLAKKKTDNTIEWAHFVERDDGRKGNVMHGTVKNTDELNLVIETINNNLRRIFGVILQPAGYDIRTLDGKKVSDTVH